MHKIKDFFVSRPVFAKRSFSYRYLLIAAILSFATLTFFVNQNPYFNFDLYITLFIQSYNAFWFDNLMRSLTTVGNPSSVTILVILLSSFGYIIGKRHAPVVLAGSTLGGLLLSFLLKVIVLRPRPDPSLINQIGNFTWFDSFPSGHVLGAVSLYGFLFYISFTQLKKGLVRNAVMIGCILVILLMGLSRIYLGAHWFSDVLGAYLVGFLWLSLVVFIYHKLKPRVVPR